MTMPPSHYINLGIGLRNRRSVGALIEGGGSCVLGALVEGFAGRRVADSHEGYRIFDTKLVRAMLWLRDKHASCPVCGWEDRAVAEVAAHLNDTHYWRRDKIGRWLDQFAVTAKTPGDDKRAVPNQTPENGKRKAASEQTPGPCKRAAIGKTPDGPEREERELEEVLA